MLQKINALFEKIGFTLAQAAGILFGIVGIICFLRYFRFGRGMLFSPRKLRILESKSLGNRQFLLVVAYEGEMFLLGIYPNGMQLLSKLPSSDEVLPKTEALRTKIPPSCWRMVFKNNGGTFGIHSFISECNRPHCFFRGLSERFALKETGNV